MELFTINDFIAYNNPCFSCNSKIMFKLGFIDEDASIISEFHPTIIKNYSETTLHHSYSDDLKLFIFHKTNKIFSNNFEGLTKWLRSHILFLSSTCPRCLTNIDSKKLEINLDEMAVGATSIAYERLIVKNKDNIYTIYSDFYTNISNLVVEKSKSQLPLTRLELSLIPRSFFESRNHFIQKMKLYSLLS